MIKQTYKSKNGIKKGSNRRLEFQLCAWFVGPRGFVLVLSTARAMEHGFSPFGRANYENVLPAVPTIHHVIDRARKLHSHGARHGAMRVGITAPGQAKKTIEKQPQTAPLRRDQSTAPFLTPFLKLIRICFCAPACTERYAGDQDPFILIGAHSPWRQPSL